MRLTTSVYGTHSNCLTLYSPISVRSLYDTAGDGVGEGEGEGENGLEGWDGERIMSGETLREEHGETRKGDTARSLGGLC